LTASSLFDHDIYRVSVLHLELLRGVVFLEPLSVEDESALGSLNSLSAAVSVHELLEVGGPLNLEVNLSAVLSLDFDVHVGVVGSSSGGTIVVLVHRAF